MSFESQYATSF